ncbi:hypothetical protein SB4_15440 [Sphingomonas sanguinis]|uniref:Uncharacterized protein n=1 Tax=Sphingomonas sanguinis TaxID=33051 RepID=A0A147IMU8_9SPHN|nr:hypothetical protein SB4_15440 [Sphingomonas sanguinis]
MVEEDHTVAISIKNQSKISTMKGNQGRTTFAGFCKRWIWPQATEISFGFLPNRRYLISKTLTEATHWMTRNAVQAVHDDV